MERIGIVSCVTAMGAATREGSSKALEELGRLPQAENTSSLSSTFPPL